MFERSKASQRYLWNGCNDCVLFAVYGLPLHISMLWGDLKLHGRSFAATAGFGGGFWWVFIIIIITVSCLLCYI